MPRGVVLSINADRLLISALNWTDGLFLGGGPINTHISEAVLQIFTDGNIGSEKLGDDYSKRVIAVGQQDF